MESRISCGGDFEDEFERKEMEGNQEGFPVENVGNTQAVGDGGWRPGGSLTGSGATEFRAVSRFREPASPQPGLLPQGEGELGSVARAYQRLSAVDRSTPAARRCG